MSEDGAPSSDALNVLMALDLGVSARSAPAETVAQMTAAGWIAPDGGTVAITPAGKRAMSATLEDAWSFAARWPIPSPPTERDE